MRRRPRSAADLPLTTADAAAYIGMSENALKLRRHRGDAPTGHQLARMTVYWPEELDAWMALHRRRRPDTAA